MTTARKHHTVPRSLLRQFTTPENPKKVHVYDKQRRITFHPVSIADAGAERDFYAVGSGELRVSWEPAFQLLDDRLAEVLRELTACENLAQVDAAIQADIPVLVATQLLRTRLQRTSVTDIAAHLNAIGEGLGIERIEFSDTDARLVHLLRLMGIQELADELRTKDIMLLQSANADNVLWISDNPVVLQNTFPYGRVGVTAPGIEIYFPIGPNRCLALYCKSIGEQIRESLDPDHPRPRLSNRLYQDLLRGIDQGVTVSISAEFVGFLNELQIGQSSRFLYSARSDFDFANRILRGRPSLGTVTSLVKLGELGAAAPPFRDMPGTFLLLESGHTHHLLPVIDRSEQCGNGSIAVTILDELKFRTINASSVFDSASLIVDGHVMNLMREIVLASESFKGEQVFVVKHINLGLQAIMETIHSQRSTQ